MLPKKGRIFLQGDGRRQPQPGYARTISDALHQELGETNQAAKTVMRWTGAGERTVKNWFAGVSGPRGEHLVALIRHSDAVLEAFLDCAGRPSIVAGARLVRSRIALIELRSDIDALLHRLS